MAGLVLIVLVTWRRDSLRRTEAVENLQRHLDRAAASGQEPLWPDGFVPASGADRSALPSDDQPVLLAYRSQPHRLILLPDGRPVVLRIGHRVKAAWMTQRDLQRQLDRQASPQQGQ